MTARALMRARLEPDSFTLLPLARGHLAKVPEKAPRLLCSNRIMAGYLKSAIYVVTFPRDEKIRTKQALVEESFAGIAPGQSQNTNVPDQMSPMLPRITLQGPNVSIAVSQISAQAEFNFEQGQCLIDDRATLEELLSKARDFQKGVNRFKSRDEIGQKGIVATINFPVDAPDSEMFGLLHKSFLKFEPSGNVAALSITAGYSIEDRYFGNLTINQYLLKSGAAAVQPGQFIDMASFPTVESGVCLIVDFNNQPELRLGISPDVFCEQVVMKAFDFAQEKSHELFKGMPWMN